MQKTQIPSIQLSSKNILGQGAVSIVYSHLSLDSQTPLALKIVRETSYKFQRECEILSLLQKQEGFPTMYGHSSSADKDQKCSSIYWIAMQKLGSSLRNQKVFPHSLDQIVGMSLQMIDRLEILHSHGYLHMDIKPDNFLFGSQKINRQTIYLIDFDMAQKIDCPGVMHASKFRGNLLYSSISQMLYGKPSIRDDLESVIYIIGQLLQGVLPWSKYVETIRESEIRNSEKAKRTLKKIIRMKMKGNWKAKGGWINQALRMICEEEGNKIYNKLRSWICRLLE